MSTTLSENIRTVRCASEWYLSAYTGTYRKVSISTHPRLELFLLDRPSRVSPFFAIQGLLSLAFLMHCLREFFHSLSVSNVFCFCFCFVCVLPPCYAKPNRNAPRATREETEHRLAVRQMPAFHTVATLCHLASECGIGGQPSPVDVLRDTTLAPLESFQAQERPEKKGKGKGRAYRQVFFVCFLHFLGNLSFRRCVFFFS